MECVFKISIVTKKNNSKNAIDLEFMDEPTDSFSPRTVNFIFSASELGCAIPGCLEKAADWHHITSVRKQKNSKEKKSEINSVDGTTDSDL